MASQYDKMQSPVTLDTHIHQGGQRQNDPHAIVSNPDNYNVDGLLVYPYQLSSIMHPIYDCCISMFIVFPYN